VKCRSSILAVVSPPPDDPVGQSSRPHFGQRALGVRAGQQELGEQVRLAPSVYFGQSGARTLASRGGRSEILSEFSKVIKTVNLEIPSPSEVC